jgi:hypothetical protein
MTIMQVSSSDENQQNHLSKSFLLQLVFTTTLANAMI